MQKLLELQTQLQASGIANREVSVLVGDGFLKIIDADMPDYPVFLVVAGDKMTCWTNVVSQSQVDEHKVAELNTILLAYNGIAGNLSNIGTGEGYYKLTGDLSSHSKIESVVIEIDSLFTSTIESMEVFIDFLTE